MAKKESGERLEALAKKLKLRPRQRRFAEVLALDPSRNQTAAAIAAGVAPGEGARVQGSRWAAWPKVKLYIAELTREATERSVAKSENTVAELSEVLETLSAHMRARLGDFLIIAEEKDGAVAVKVAWDKVKNAPSGLVRQLEHQKRGPRIRLESAQQAAATLLAFYQSKEGLKLKHSFDDEIGGLLKAALEARRKGAK